MIVTVLASRDFQVLGVRGGINKPTTFGTEDRCNLNPLEATVTIGAALRYQTLRSLTATEIGAGAAT